ncbi:MAG: TerC family protein [Alphaproteobacteria bacterium]|nr:TerC family protein [Alphaproteobacteria bacterium]
MDYLSSPQVWLALAEIIWINILLSGDNAVVIALACRSLPADKRRIGIVLGSGVAIVLRIIFTIFIVWLLKVPYLQLIGGALLLWIAVKLVVGEDEGEGDDKIKASVDVWGAVRTIAIADAVMSLDNVIAIAAVAKDDLIMLITGLAISMPLIIFGSQLVLALLGRYPILVTAGGALLGWIGGETIVKDAALAPWVNDTLPILVDQHVAPMVGAVAVVALGKVLMRRRARAKHAQGG